MDQHSAHLKPAPRSTSAPLEGTNDPTTATAQRVRDALAAAERTAAWASIKAGIPATTLSRKLNGHTDFTVSEVARIAAALDLHPAELLPFEVAA